MWLGHDLPRPDSSRFHEAGVQRLLPRLPEGACCLFPVAVDIFTPKLPDRIRHGEQFIVAHHNAASFNLTKAGSRSESGTSMDYTTSRLTTNTIKPPKINATGADSAETPSQSECRLPIPALSPSTGKDESCSDANQRE